jgi:peptide/nickel transport system substrate-binding protein
VVNNKKINDNFNLYTPEQFAYSYLGVNTRNPKLSDKLTRQALAHLMDYDRYMNDVNYGYATRIIGPVHPLRKNEYNHDITPYEYNVEKAKELLKQSGWGDNNGDGTLDKMIDGSMTDLTITFIYNTGNEEREKTALIFQESCKKAGINLKIQNHDWGVFLDMTKNHDFEMYYGAWIGEPAPDDFSQIYHTESAQGGSNYVYFGSADSDALIEKINTTLNEEERAQLVKEFQAILHDEVSYIYLSAPQNRMAIHKRFENTRPSAYRPGYWEGGFKLTEVTEDGKEEIEDVD